jgi:thiazole synthase ThiGH ThiG subunit
MNIDQLHQLHVKKLSNSFGVANAQSAIRDDRMARAFGTSDENKSETDKGKVEY